MGRGAHRDFPPEEEEVETIDFSYFERAYSDKRPFFQEGKGIFEIGGVISPFYSRRIEAIDAGVKLYGRKGRNSFGVTDYAD